MFLLKATITGTGDSPEISDEVKYMVVRPDTFYPHLIRLDNKGEQIRNALAAQAVYGPSDAPEFALKMLNSDELRDLGVPWDIRQLIGEPSSVPGFTNGVYRDHVSGVYILAFAGTDDYDDIIVDLWNGIGGFTEQYQAAMDIGRSLADQFRSLGLDFLTTGHSLGGGLASAAAVVGNMRADTFNAAGLEENILYARDEEGIRIEGTEQYPGSLGRYSTASTLIDAYYLDWDILSFVQDWSPGLAISAIGERILMDGPVDAEMATISAASLASLLIPGAGWVNVVAELGASAYYMGLSHTTDYYHYGVMVDEATGWDIYGYEL